ncbi:MAG: hypothetical protein AB2693_29345 [Candidatus Thiodiazotropha sp.]
MFFEDLSAGCGGSSFARDTERFYNPKIKRVDVTIDGISNQLFGQGMRSHQMSDEARKFFAVGGKRHPEVAAVAKDLAGSGRRKPWRIPDQQVCPVARSADK